MVDQSLILNIKQMRARGKTYEEISQDLHVGFSTVSKALKASSTTLERNIDYETSFFRDESPIYGENTTLPPYPSSIEGSRVSVDSDTSINKKATMLVAGSGGLYLVSMDSPGPSLNSQLINAPLPSWFWKLFFFLVGVVMFIRILKRMGGDALENE